MSATIYDPIPDGATVEVELTVTVRMEVIQNETGITSQELGKHLAEVVGELIEEDLLLDEDGTAAWFDIDSDVVRVSVEESD